MESCGEESLFVPDSELENSGNEIWFEKQPNGGYQSIGCDRVESQEWIRSVFSQIAVLEKAIARILSRSPENSSENLPTLACSVVN